MLKKNSEVTGKKIKIFRKFVKNCDKCAMLNATFWAIFKHCAWAVVCIGAPSIYNAKAQAT